MKYLVLLIFLCTVSFSLEISDDLPKYIPDEPNLYIAANDFLEIIHRPGPDAVIKDFGDAELWQYSVRTRQLSKLSGKIDALSHLVGTEFTEQNFKKIMSGPAAMAFYGIGDVEFLFISKIGIVPPWVKSGRFQKSVYSGFEFGNASNEDGDEAAYCIANGYFIAGNKISLVEKSVDLIKGKGAPLSSNPQFKTVAEKLPKEPDLIAYLNMDSLTSSQYWKRYWFQNDQTAQKPIIAAAWGYQFAKDEAVETRILSHNKGFTDNFTTQSSKTLARIFPENTLVYREISGAKPANFSQISYYFAPFEELGLSLDGWLGNGAWGIVSIGDAEKGLPQFVAVSAFEVSSPKNCVSLWEKQASKLFAKSASFGDSPELKAEKREYKGEEIIAFEPIPGTDLGLYFTALGNAVLVSPSGGAIKKCIEASKGKALGDKKQFKEICGSDGQLRTFANLEIGAALWSDYFKIIIELPGWDSWWAKTKTENEIVSMSGVLNDFKFIGDIENIASNLTVTKRIYQFK